MIGDGCVFCACEGCGGCSKHQWRECRCDLAATNEIYQRVYKEDDPRYNGKED